MKNELKKKAQLLRKNGMSIPFIAKKLSVSKSSVSIWIKDIVLTDNQLIALRKTSNEAAVKANKQKGLNNRINYQSVGRKRIYSETPLYLAGCMLYWGEGSKDLHSVKITNSDINVILLFKKFLETYFQVSSDQMTLTINCYDDFHTITEIENWWLLNLNLDRVSLRKGQVNNVPQSSKLLRKNKLEYGTCSLKVNSTKIIQEIYGAIQEYGGFVNNKWLNGE